MALAEAAPPVSPWGGEGRVVTPPSSGNFWLESVISHTWLWPSGSFPGSLCPVTAPSDTAKQGVLGSSVGLSGFAVQLSPGDGPREGIAPQA